MPFLKWIDDDKLCNAVTQLLKKANEAKIAATKEFGRNIIDPFSAMFEISGFEIDYDTWIKSETTRQAQKTLQNHIGGFHQIILSSADGWLDLKTGGVVDLHSEKNKIIAEVKNKYNTISGGKLSGLYFDLEGLVMPKASKYKGYTAYYVTIIPKTGKRYNKEFTPSNNKEGKKCASNALIREIDGASFYTLVTGREKALEELFDVLPEVILNCSDGKYKIADKEKLKSFFNLAYQ